MLFLCQHGYEALLERELVAAGLSVKEKGPGWALTAGRASRPDEPLAEEGGSSRGFALPDPALPDLAFPHLTLLAPREIMGESVNALAQQLADWFFASLRGERIEASWPCVSQMVPEVVGLGRRASAVEKAFDELLKKKLSRVAKLAVPPVRLTLFVSVDSTPLSVRATSLR